MCRSEPEHTVCLRICWLCGMGLQHNLSGKSLAMLPGQQCFCRDDSKSPLVRWVLALVARGLPLCPLRFNLVTRECCHPLHLLFFLLLENLNRAPPRLGGVGEVQGETFQTDSCTHRVSCLPAVSSSISQPQDLPAGDSPICFFLVF